MQRSCNAARRCNCCFLASATILRRSRTLQLLCPGLCNAPATLPDAATAASRATGRSCNAARRCNCCFWRSQILPWRDLGTCNDQEYFKGVNQDKRPCPHNDQEYLKGVNQDERSCPHTQVQRNNRSCYWIWCDQVTVDPTYQSG